MRNVIISLLFLTAIFIVSCDKTENILNQQESNTSIFKQVASDVLITLPERSSLYQDSVYTVSKEINGETGGLIEYHNYYISVDGDSIVFDINLTVPKNAYTGSETITVTLDNMYAAVQFNPSMVFLKPLSLFQSFQGLNLEGIGTGAIDFVYVNDSNVIETVIKNGVQVIAPRGIVRVMNARLDHFSKYGWVRSCD